MTEYCTRFGDKASHVHHCFLAKALNKLAQKKLHPPLFGNAAFLIAICRPTASSNNINPLRRPKGSEQ